MNTIGDQELQAWLDGELDAADAARVEAAIAADAGLAERARRERDLRARLRAQFDPVLDEAVPERLHGLLGTPGRDAHRGDAMPGGGAHSAAASASRIAPSLANDNVIPLPTRAERSPRLRWNAPLYALAASVALLAVGLWLRRDATPVRIDDGRIVATAELARGLESSLASAAEPGAPVAIGLTFRDADGRICRSFQLRGDTVLAGLACRSADGWDLPVLSAAPPTGDDAVRQAASALPAAVQAAVDARLQGEVFDAAQEREARAAGWR